MSDELFPRLHLARLRSELPPLLNKLESIASQQENKASLLHFLDLNEETLYTLFECLYRLGLVGDARSLVGTLKALGAYAVGPKFSEILAGAFNTPEERERMIQVLGEFPTPEELAATKEKRKTTDRIAFAELNKAIDIIKRLQTAIENSTGADALDDSEKVIDDEQTDAESRAIALVLAADKEGKRIKIGDVALAVGVSRTSTYRWTRFKATLTALKAKRRASIPKGNKTKGKLEAVGFDPDEE
jgi:hypothetical protein